MRDALKKIVKPYQFRQQQEQYRLAQGRLTAVEAADRLAGSYDIPLCTAQPQKGEPVTIGMIGQPVGGHLLVVAPPTSRWAEQIMYTVARWPDAALVVDPGGKLHARTGQFRQKMVGKVYTLPGYRLDLGHYYGFWDEKQAQKLHAYLMPPYPAADRHLVERSVALFTAVGHYAYVYKRNLMQVLLDVAACDMQLALKGLETIPHARLYVHQFCKGLTPQETIHDKEVTQAFMLFTRQLARYQEHYNLFATEPAQEVIPQNWVQAKGTIYLTYDPERLAQMGGLATAIVAGLVRYHLSHGDHKGLLLVLAVDTAVQIPQFSQLLHMVADFGVTVVLLASSWEGLRLVAGEDGRESFIGHFANQLWYPPQDGETAQQMSNLLGSQLCPDSAEKQPVLTADEILAWSGDDVLVRLFRERPYRFIGQRLKLPDYFYLYRTPLLPPTGTPAPRHYLDWLPALPAPQPPQSPQVAAPAPKVLPSKVEIVVPQKEEKPAKRGSKPGLK